MTNLSAESTKYLVIIAVVYLLLMLWALASYIITSYSHFFMAKDLGVKLYGFAWVPIARCYIIGALADKADNEKENGKDKKFRFVLIWLAGAFAVTYIIFFIIYFATMFNFIQGTIYYEIEPQVTQVLSFIGSILSACIPMILVASAMSAVEIVCIYKIMDMCKEDKTIKNFLIFLLVPFAAPFVWLSCKKSLDAKLKAKINVEANPTTFEMP